MLTQQPDRHANPSAALPRRRARLLDLVPYAGVAVATVLLGLPTLSLSLHPDQAMFALMGRAVAEGRVLYVDAWDLKPPLIYLLYALVTRLPFGDAADVRVFDLAWTALTAVLVYELGRRYWSRRAGLIAALSYALVWSTNDPWWQSAQPDSLVVLPLALGLLLYEVARPCAGAPGGRPGWLIASGLAFGVALQLRPNTALFLPVLPFVELAAVERSRWLGLWSRRMLWVGAGVCAVQVVSLLYLALGGALGEFVATLRYVGGYTRAGGPWNTSAGPDLGGYLKVLRTAFWTWAAPLIALTLPALVAGAYGWLVVRERRVQQLVLLALLTYAGIALQAKFFWYHFGYMLLFLALIGSWGWDRLLDTLTRTRSAAVAWLSVATLTGLLLLSSTMIWDSGVRQWSGLNTYLETGSDGQYRTGLDYDPAEVAVGNYLREHTAPQDTIFVWGFAPGIYAEAERPGASRFLSVFPLMSDWSPRRWQGEFVAELERARPVYIVVQRITPGNGIVGHNLTAVVYIEQFPAFKQFLTQNYVYETDVAGAILYRRID